MAESLVPLSERGRIAIKPGRDDLEQFMTGLSDPYHPIDNKKGYLVLLVAENKLSVKMLLDKIQSVCRNEQIPSWVSGYGDFRGEMKFREALSSMMQDTFVQAPVDKNCLVVQASEFPKRRMTGGKSLLKCAPFI
jgi:hypothetical protein